ncbi:hypothetical protein BC941DRAFT_253346 [Chlamydoabsidia padenii]|nr:hypothetical protein BC941DRAFT_253346 [Chlamydoabsidia padenii]
MQWRALVLLLTGLIVIYLVSLLQETPYPHPAKLYIPPPSSHHSTSTLTTFNKLRRPPDATLLTLSDTHVYHTCLWYELSPPTHNLRLGSRSFKNGGLGYLLQQRQALSVFHLNTTDISSLNHTTTPEWEITREQVFNGPISHHSSLGNGGGTDNSSTALQFAVLYQVLDDEDLQHWVRVFYFPTNTDTGDSIVSAGLEFKDVLLPGSSWISYFSLEPSSILYSRDPDSYRFRWVRLPNDLTTGPHSEQADLVILDTSEHGDRTYLYDQPDDIEEHSGLISTMYSPM